jgi:hypothetical protein
MIDEPLILVGKLGLAVSFFILLSFFGRKFVDRLPPMPAATVQALLLYIFIFTCGVGILSCGSTISTIAGAAVSLLGISLFLPESAVIRLIGIFVLSFGLCLGTFLGWGFEPFLHLQKPMEFSCSQSVAMIFWGLGVLFAWRRWHLGRRAAGQNSDLPPKISSDRSS